MKKFSAILFVMAIFAVNVVFAEAKFLGKRYSFIDEAGSAQIFNDKIMIFDETRNGKLEMSNGVSYFKTESENYVILYYETPDGEFLTLVKPSKSKEKYASWEMAFYKSVSDRFSTKPKLIGFQVKKADAYITEKDKSGNDIKFLSEGFFNVTSNPWAVSKDSKSKKIYLKDGSYCVPSSTYADIDEIFILNGFVNPEKPYLYEQNSRAKNIRIQYGDVSFVAKLEDVGNYQSVKLPQSIKRNRKNTEIVIEILDSYEGSKYSDIVISGILYMDATLQKN